MGIQISNKQTIRHWKYDILFLAYDFNSLFNAFTGSNQSQYYKKIGIHLKNSWLIKVHGPTIKDSFSGLI